MSLTLSNAGDRIAVFKTKPPKYEQTFKTPLEDLARFTDALLSPFQEQEATVLIDQVVFTPHTLLAFLAEDGFSPEENLRNVQIIALGENIPRQLLEATLSDWVDFLFLPVSGRFALYADHDEWTTAFSDDPDTLEAIRNSMNNGSFELISSYKRF